MKQIEDFLSRELKNDEMIVINGGLSSEVTEGKGNGCGLGCNGLNGDGCGIGCGLS